MKDNATYIHRGEFRPDRSPNDLTSFICWDYMGSSEFEFYSFPRTFKLMKSLHLMHPLRIHPIEAPSIVGLVSEKTAYAVADEVLGGLEMAKLVLETDLNKEYGLRKEPTYIRRHFFQAADRPFGARFDCWLNINPRLDKGSEAGDMYPAERVRMVCSESWNAFRPFFLTSNRKAAELFLGRVTS